MKLVTDIFFRFARSLEGASLDGTEAEIALPSVLTPVLSLQGPIRAEAGFNATEEQRESFFKDERIAQAASQALLTTNVCTLASGLWDLQLAWAYVASFTQAYTNTVTRGMAVNLAEPSPSTDTENLIEAWAVANVPAYGQLHTRFLFPLDGYRVRLILGATGAGQTMIGRVLVVASRLH